MEAGDWRKLILGATDPSAAWRGILAGLGEAALAAPDAKVLHHATVPPDRLLAESAWELWQAYPASALRTSQELIRWCAEPPGPGGKAVLILDALSLHQLRPLMAAAAARGVKPVSVRVTGAEIPSDTTPFALALGIPQRSALAGGTPPAGFRLFGGVCATDVLSHPFEDCLGAVPEAPNILLWHSWLDDLIHVHKKSPDAVSKAAGETLTSDGFWRFVNRLRQGRRLVITADHGHTLSQLFSSAVRDEETVTILRDAFGGSRSKAADVPWSHSFMPPAVCTVNGHHVVMGQCKWPVQGGFPQLCHGGLSLLEMAVPWVELPAL